MQKNTQLYKPKQLKIINTS